jgi:transposase InsO family protein
LPRRRPASLIDQGHDPFRVAGADLVARRSPLVRSLDRHQPARPAELESDIDDHTLQITCFHGSPPLRKAKGEPNRLTLPSHVIFYVGNMKGVGRIYQQTFIDTDTKVAFAKLYDRKTPITAADLLNDRVVPFFDEQEIRLCRVLTDRGTEYCGSPERHEYELYLAVDDIDHSRTKTKSPQTNGICERFHRTVLEEFYRVAFRKKIYRTLGELKTDLDLWLEAYNERRPHQGRWCSGKTPMQTFLDAIPLAKEKIMAA